MNQSMTILAQYVRRLSVLNPGIIEIMSGEEGEPRVGVDIQVKAGEIADNVYEVILMIKVDAKKNEEDIFNVQLDYSAVVKIEADNNESATEQTLLVHAPTFLFPFARNIVSDATRDCGYPPVFLSPVNFSDLFEQKKRSVQ
jgi:preprotein translocase subunit SecB